jgi:hypothetical protein
MMADQMLSRIEGHLYLWSAGCHFNFSSSLTHMKLYYTTNLLWGFETSADISQRE